MHRPSSRRSAVRIAATALVAGTGLLLTGTGAAVAAPRATAGTKMDIERNVYLVKDLKVSLGETVTWVNKDKAAHTVTTTKAPAKIDSPLFKQGESFSHRFVTAGNYEYYCAVHPDMVATVAVSEKATKPAKVAKPAKKAKKAELGAEAPKSGAQDNAKGTKANSDNAHAGMGRGDAATPSARHQDNAKDSAAPGTSDNGAPAAPAPAAPSAPAADPVSAAYDPFMKHLEVAHFQRTPAGQAQDIVEFDSWGKAHLALVRTMLDPEVGKSSAVGGAPMASTFMQHLDVAHWNTSPMEQASAISNFDSWNASHLAMFRIMFDPLVGKSSVLGSSAGTGVFMQHLDAAHWNLSANEQASAVADEPAAWAASHQKLAEAMVASAGSGSTPSS